MKWFFIGLPTLILIGTLLQAFHIFEADLTAHKRHVRTKPKFMVATVTDFDKTQHSTTVL